MRESVAEKCSLMTPHKTVRKKHSFMTVCKTLRETRGYNLRNIYF